MTYLGQSREEIEKWRAERRKNFPTRDKVAVKDAAREEARERGEVLRLQKVNVLLVHQILYNWGM